MIIQSSQKETELRQNMRGGPGSVSVSQFLPKEQLPPGYRLLGELSLEQGCGIGTHTHEKESETFYILAGEGVYSDNGEEFIVKAGDVCICYAGGSHSVRNDKEETVRILAVILEE